jgi:hypothetical protein
MQPGTERASRLPPCLGHRVAQPNMALELPDLDVVLFAEGPCSGSAAAPAMPGPAPCAGRRGECKAVLLAHQITTRD